MFVTSVAVAFHDICVTLVLQVCHGHRHTRLLAQQQRHRELPQQPHAPEAPAIPGSSGKFPRVWPAKDTALGQLGLVQPHTTRLAVVVCH